MKTKNKSLGKILIKGYLSNWKSKPIKTRKQIKKSKTKLTKIQQEYIKKKVKRKQNKNSKNLVKMKKKGYASSIMIEGITI